MNKPIQLLLISNDKVYIEQLKKVLQIAINSINVIVFNKVSEVIPYLGESTYLKLIIIKLDDNYNVSEIRSFVNMKNSTYHQRVLLHQKVYKKQVRELNMETSNYLQDYIPFFKNKNLIEFFNL